MYIGYLNARVTDVDENDACMASMKGEGLEQFLMAAEIRLIGREGGVGLFVRFGLPISVFEFSLSTV